MSPYSTAVLLALSALVAVALAQESGEKRRIPGAVPRFGKRQFGPPRFGKREFGPPRFGKRMWRPIIDTDTDAEQMGITEQMQALKRFGGYALGRPIFTKYIARIRGDNE